MKNKRLFAGLLFLVMVFSMMFGFADPVDNESMALFDLGILKGDGVSFHLDQTLSRAEALAFISRIKGEEATLSSLYASTNETKFKDNMSNQWYTPYINYGVATGLVNGYADGTFKPSGKLTDQAFVKLLLVALGYTFDTDFTWDTVFPFAFEKGLILEVPLKQSPILRGDVVTLIYRALQMDVRN